MATCESCGKAMPAYLAVWVDFTLRGFGATETICLECAVIFEGAANAVQRAVRTAQAQIREDVASGIVPASVGSFAELHDYVDANEYGAEANRPAPSTDVLHDTQDHLDAWIKSGGLRAGK